VLDQQRQTFLSWAAVLSATLPPTMTSGSMQDKERQEKITSVCRATDKSGTKLHWHNVYGSPNYLIEIQINGEAPAQVGHVVLSVRAGRPHGQKAGR